MQVKKTQLQEALSIVKPGLANKEVIEQSTSFAFIKGRVVTYNDELCFSHPVEGLELEGAVEAEALYKFLGKIKGDDIELTLKGNEIVFVSGRAKAGLTLQSEIKLPLDQEVSKKGKWKELPENFTKFLGFAMTSCSSDMSKPKLTCVHVRSEGYIEATDNRRITKTDLKEEMPVKSFLLPAGEAVEVVRINPKRIAEGQGWIHFESEEGTILSCRLQDEEEDYPKMDSHLSVKGVQIILPKSTAEMIDRAMVFAKRGHILDESLSISIQDNKFKIRAEGEGSSWFEEDVNLKYSGDPINFLITPYLLRGILNETQECVISDKKLKFEGENWEYVTLLRGV